MAAYLSKVDMPGDVKSMGNLELFTLLNVHRPTPYHIPTFNIYNNFVLN
jgi:hypothetical protein